MAEPTRENLYNYADGSAFTGKKTAEIFNEIYRANFWTDHQSVSGIGSSLEQTREIIRLLPGVLQQFGVRTLLDIPCGDFNWMQKVDLTGIDYTGADIVEALIETNRRRYAGNGVRFIHFDLLQNKMDAFDLVFCRDCLVHLSFEDIGRALENIRKSNSGYLLTTTFTRQAANTDIHTGGWRPLNLQAPPFNFPEPIHLLDEKCTEKDGAFADKCLGLWEVERIRQIDLAESNPQRGCHGSP